MNGSLRVKKQKGSLFCDGNLYSIYTFQIKSSLESINLEFFLFLKSINKQCIQCFIVDVSL